MIYERIFETLNRHGVKYLVVGGVAVVLYGCQRFTYDLDIVVQLEADNIKRLAKAAAELRLVPRVPVKIEQLGDEKVRQGWIDDKGMIVFTLVTLDNPPVLVDIFVKEPFDFDKAYNECKKIKAGEIDVPIVSIDALIYLKKEAARAKDLADIAMLEELKKCGKI